MTGKTIIFGRDNGINLDGHVILSSGEVRANWLDTIKRANRHNHIILKIPKIELALSRTLKDINVVHRYGFFGFRDLYLMNVMITSSFPDLQKV